MDLFLAHLGRVYVLHFHSFFFLILTLQILVSRIAGLVFIPEPITILAVVAASFYVPVYLYKAMRKVYGQGHIITFVKYLSLSVAYMIGAAFTMMGALLFALVSI